MESLRGELHGVSYRHYRLRGRSVNESYYDGSRQRWYLGWVVYAFSMFIAGETPWNIATL